MDLHIAMSFWQKANNKAYYGRFHIVQHSGLYLQIHVYLYVCVWVCVCLGDLWVLLLFGSPRFLFYFVAASKYFQQSWFACLNTFFNGSPFPLYYSCLLSDCSERFCLLFKDNSSVLLFIIFLPCLCLQISQVCQRLVHKTDLVLWFLCCPNVEWVLSCQARSVQKLVFDNGRQKRYLKALPSILTTYQFDNIRNCMQKYWSLLSVIACKMFA